MKKTRQVCLITNFLLNLNSYKKLYFNLHCSAGHGRECCYFFNNFNN
jgi:hypothetical protein